MTFEEWRAAVGEAAREIVGLNDVLDENDPYDLADTMEDAHDAGQTPREFLEEAFSEELASRQYDVHLQEESDGYWEEGDELGLEEE